MPRSVDSIDGIISSAVSSSIARIVPKITAQIATLAAERLERQLKVGQGIRGRTATLRRARRRPGEITRWVPDRRARRVPLFVIEATKLDTKRAIVAKFGPDAVFEKGKPLPVTKKPSAK